MKIIEDPQTRLYELTYLVPAVFTESEISKMREDVLALVKKFKGDVVSTQDWGKKTLAYSIRHNSKDVTEAIYTHLELSFLSKNAPLFEKEVYLLPNLIRHLMVKADEKKKETKEVKEVKVTE